MRLYWWLAAILGFLAIFVGSFFMLLTAGILVTIAVYAEEPS